MTLLRQIYRFCERVARYSGPEETEAIKTLSQWDYGEGTSPLNRAFELGYKRGYADCAEYVADWIEEEDDEEA